MDLKEYPEELKTVCRSRLFDQMDEGTALMLLTKLRPRRVPLEKGDVFLRDGQNVWYVALVAQGRLTASKLFQDGHESLLCHFEPSYMVGIDIVTTKTCRSTYYVTALTDAVIYVFRYEKLRKKGFVPERERLVMMENILALIAGENLRRMNQIEVLASKSVRERILTYLSIRAGFVGSREFDIPFNREEWAAYLGVNRSRLSGELGRMRQEGLIEIRKNHVRLLDVPLYRLDTLK